MDNTEIKKIIDSEFKFTPVEKAAAILYSRGVRAETLHKIKTGSGISDPIRVAVYNELRDIERKNKRE